MLDLVPTCLVLSQCVLSCSNMFCPVPTCLVLLQHVLSCSNMFCLPQFHRNARRDAVEFLLERIEGKQKYGGAELFVRSEPQEPGTVSYITYRSV